MQYLAKPLLPSGGKASSQAVFTANVKEPAATWLREAVAEVEELTSLAPDWNGYGAKVVEAGSAVAAVRFLLRAALPQVSRPDIVPVADGGVQVEWHRGGVDLEVCFSPDESVGYLDVRESGDEPTEFPASDAVSILAGVQSQLQEA